jgi:hypothetical protein
MTFYVVLFVDLACIFIKEVVAYPLFLLLILYQVQKKSSSSSIISSVDSPNHKLGMVCEKSPPLQSTFIAPMQSTQLFSPQLLSSSTIGQFSIPHHVYNNSTQDLSLDLDVEAVKSNLGLDDESRLCVCNEDYIFSQDLFTNDEFLVSNSNSCSKHVDQGDDYTAIIFY